MATISGMASQIETYQDMSLLSAEMVVAARTNNWERLVTLEQSVALLRHTLATAVDDGLSDQELELKATLIRRILDDDAEIRRHTEPWMERMRRFLGGTDNRAGNPGLDAGT
jgi:flagellar protein FliT